MKKPILLIISNNSYFQPSFLNNVCRVISKTNYYVETIFGNKWDEIFPCDLQAKSWKDLYQTINKNFILEKNYV